jgi:hypothetical protein
MHPGIATVYAFIETPHGHFIASEFVAGRTLREELAEGPIEPRRAVRLAADIVQALAAAHHAQVVHRDLKPENILVTPDGTVKVIDFGIARLGRASGPVLTAPGALQGTLGYMAPEQMVAGAVADARADIYAVGVIVAEMLLGAHPLENRVVLPAWIDPIVRRCLESDRERRYRSARDLAADLEQAAAALDAEPARVRPAASSDHQKQARWWWQLHQALAALVYWAMVVPAWYGRVSVGGRTGRTLFFLTLTGLVLASILRLHLWFVMRTTPGEFIRQRRREIRWILFADALFAVPLLITGGLIADAHIALAVLLVAVGVGSGVVATFIEPATTRAAFPESFE